MINERRPSDDLQPGEHDDHHFISIPTTFNYTVWYVDADNKDQSVSVVASYDEEAKVKASRSIDDMRYVVRVDKGKAVK
jgi:glutamine amidotransferase-like uncharacterized protein